MSPTPHLARGDDREEGKSRPVSANGGVGAFMVAMDEYTTVLTASQPSALCTRRSASAYAQRMKRGTWIVVGVALGLGFIAGFVGAGMGDEPQLVGTAVGSCPPLDAEATDAMNAALFPWRGLSFERPRWIGDLRGPLTGLTIIRAEVDGPGFEGAGDVSLWATGPGRTGTFPGLFLYSLNPIARRVEGRATFPGNRLRQVVDDGEPVYDPRVIRSIAPVVAAPCIESPAQGS